MTQDELSMLSIKLLGHIHAYTNGMCTVGEFLNVMARIAACTTDTCVEGLTDPMTGIRYPTQEETDTFMKGFES